MKFRAALRSALAALRARSAGLWADLGFGTRLVPLLLLTLPAAVQAEDFIYTTDNGTITITGYIGPDGAVTIPSTIHGLPVTRIEDYAFFYCYSLASVTIGSSVIRIEFQVFFACTRLTAIRVKALNPAFSSVDGVLFNQTQTTPSFSSSVFKFSSVTVYYLPHTTGWDTDLFGNRTALWLPEAQIGDAGFGVRTNRFGFNIRWASDTVVVVEASQDLSNPIWTPVSTNTLTDGSSYFSDPQWTNYPARFYRLLSPAA